MKSLRIRPWLLLRRDSVPRWPRRSATYLGQRRFESTSDDGDINQTYPGLQKSSIHLRNYQEDCIQSVLNAIQSGRRQVGVSLATGSGKTVIFTELIGRVPQSTDRATQTLILVHRRELVEQAARHCAWRYPEKSVEIEMGKLEASGAADITIASVQSINSRDRINKFDPERFKLLLVDEAHHIVASGYLKVLHHFGLQSETEDATAALVGVSATMSRFDGMALGKAIKHIVYHKDYVDMIGEKWLSDVVFTTVKSNANISKVKKAATGDFQTRSLSKAVNTDEVNQITISTWQLRAGDRKSTIVFCVDVAHVKRLTNAFRLRGVDSRYVTGDTSKVTRSQTLEAFRNQEFPVLLNCGVFTEGTDIPNIDCVLLARPTRSRNLLVQMIGRGMRLHPGKANCHVIDMVASLESGIITAPTLFGLDPDEVMTNASLNDIEKAKQKQQEGKSREETSIDIQRSTSAMQQDLQDNLTFTDYNSVSELVEDTSSERYIRAISQNAWVRVGDDRYILSNGTTRSYMTIERNSAGDLFLVKLTDKLPFAVSNGAVFAKPRVVATSETFEGAVHGADTYASRKFAHAFIALRAPGNWRAKPASEAQLTLLNKYRDPEDCLAPGDISKGRAGDMITKIRFGAVGRVQKIAMAKRKFAKAEQQKADWEGLQKQEKVQIGPVPVSPTAWTHRNDRLIRDGMLSTTSRAGIIKTQDSIA